MQDVALSRSLQHRTQFLKDLAASEVEPTMSREDLAHALSVLAEGARILLQSGEVYPEDVRMDAPRKFWPVAAGQTRKELVELIGQMNFELVQLRGDVEALTRKTLAQRETLRQLQGVSAQE